MKNILVPIDFSTASHSASEYATSLASVFNARVIFINAIVPPVVIDDVASASLLMSQAELLENNRGLMEKEIEALSKKHAVKIDGFIREGFAPDIMEDMARSKQADVIVMGMKGKGKSNSVFGSTTTTIIRKSLFPILVIPENAVYKTIDTITVAADFNSEIEMARYAPLQKLAEKYNSFIQILNVQKNDSAMSSEEVIGKMKTDLVFNEFRHSFHTVEDDNVIEGLSKFIEKNPTDVLAMIAHKHSVFERFFGKVYTKTMSHQTKIPLLVLQNK